jgi:hypothetical protein
MIHTFPDSPFLFWPAPSFGVFKKGVADKNQFITEKHKRLNVTIFVKEGNC